MKKILFTTVVLLVAASAAAQDWKDALKKIATTAVDEVTDGKLTQYALDGTWNYTGPGVKFEGEDMLSDLGAAALESTVVEKLEKAYSLVGIKAGASSFTFERADSTFTAVLGKHQLSGTYAYDAEKHTVALHFAKGKLNLGTVEGHAYVSGTDLQLVFPVTKLVNLVTSLGSKVSSLSTLVTLLKKYEDVYLGFAFSR